MTVHLPTASIPKYWLKQDLAELVDVESNGIAQETLEQALRETPKQLRDSISVDHESDFVYVYAETAEAIIVTVNAILKIAKKSTDARVSKEDLDRLFEACKSWKPQQAQKWETGDIFAIRLKDDSFGFGVVLDSQKPPRVGLYDHRETSLPPDRGKLSTSSVISVQLVTADLLDEGDWIVVGKQKPGFLTLLGRSLRKVTRSGGVSSTVIGSGNFSDLADACHGLVPWNSKFEEDYFDRLLKFGVCRPKAAVLLSREEREKYRVAQGWQ